jgi:hypothetical protein
MKLKDILLFVGGGTVEDTKGGEGGVTASGSALSTDLFTISDDTYESVGSLELVKDRQFQDELSESGTGTLTMMNDDDAISSFGRDGCDLVQFSVDGIPAWTLIVEKMIRTQIAESEESDEVTIWSGRGHLALLERAVVYPVHGPNQQPIQEDRVFNWTAYDFNDGLWDDVHVVAYADDAKRASLGGSTPWDDSEDLAWYADEPLGPPPGNPAILGPADGTVLNVDDSTRGDQFHYFRQHVTLPDGRLTIHFAADNLGEVYLDGLLLMSTEDWRRDNFVSFDCSSGDHVIAVSLVNIPQAPANPCGFSWVIVDQNYPFTDPIAMSDDSGTMLTYQLDPPGMTPGEVINICINEAVNRGELGWIDGSMIDDNFDMNGNEWPRDPAPTISTKVGTDYFTFFREIAGTYIDMYMPPDSLQLQIWRYEEKGNDSTLTWGDLDDPDSVKPTGLIYEEDYVVANRVLSRWVGGWMQVDRTSQFGPIRGATLGVGAIDSAPEVVRVSQSQLQIFGDVRQQITIGILPEGVEDNTPYVGLWKTTGDTVNIPLSDGSLASERVLSMTVTEDNDNGRAIFTPTVKDIILQGDERADQAIKKMTNGTFRGASKAAQPVIPTYVPRPRIQPPTGVSGS